MMLGSAVCQICTDTYDAERAVAAMPCGHTFHDDCLSKWLANARNCPACRKPLKKTQHPIHRLFFSLDANASQLGGSPTSPKSQDPMILEKNRKLQAQVSALQAAISKLKSECQQSEDEKVALSCAMNDKNNEIQTLGRTQDKLKRKLREFTSRQDEVDALKTELAHLQNVRTILDGVESDVRHMLEEQAGYTAQQLTYVVLLRQQLDNSKRGNEKLKRDITEYREKLAASNRKCGTGESEIELLKLELKQAEARNVNLRKKCDLLIKSMNSPRGAAASLATRIVHQSPAPDFLTPPPVPGSTNQKRSRDTNFAHTSTPAIDLAAVDTSSDLFNESSAFGISDVVEDEVKQTLDFLDDDSPHSKKPKLLTSKEQLTQDKTAAGDSSPAQSSFSVPIKPKSSLKLKPKSKLKPINPTAGIGRVKDMTNLPRSSTASTSSSSCFRQGFDGMGGQSSTFSSRHNAMQFNVFKKPSAVRSKPKPDATSQQKIQSYIVLD